MLGPLIVGIKGLMLTPEDKILLQQPLIGGVILFARNYNDVPQVRALVAEIKALRSPALWVSVDHEGGRVQRFINGFTRLPSLGQLGALYESDPSGALQQANEWGFCMAQELLGIGVDMSFAPVIDLNKNKLSLIGDRSFHRKADIVTRMAKAWCDGVHRAGMKTCAKHFPGHGDVIVDSHDSLPIDERSYDQIAADDLVPFMQLIKEDVVDSIMPAHIVFPQVDDRPAGFSSIWVQDILRQQCQFKGVIISDDLGMGGAEGMGTYPQRLQSALAAGCDLILLCNDHSGIKECVETVTVDATFDRSESIAQLYGHKVRRILC
ncbi:MAG: beta-hexosaminidase [Gammaproteobacteria bacterium]|jgi:beta-N-acetylhexosaminidase|nr:beta-hexosaminidase [Gammaproteobacteria bacterium]